MESEGKKCSRENEYRLKLEAGLTLQWEHVSYYLKTLTRSGLMNGAVGTVMTIRAHHISVYTIAPQYRESQVQIQVYILKSLH